MRMRFMLVLAVSLIATTPGVRAQSATDRERIDAVAASWERNWNAHDMDALFLPFSVDADFVNVAGHHWKGRDEIVRKHRERLPQFIYSTWKTKTVEVQFLTPAIALAHVEWSLRDDTEPDGTPRQPRDGIFTWVLVKQHGDWRVRSAQNTNLNNPMFVSK